MRQALAFIGALSIVNFGILIYLILPDSPDSPFSYNTSPAYRSPVYDSSRDQIYGLKSRIDQLESSLQQERWQRELNDSWRRP